MQEVERRAVGQKIQQHGDDADAERDHAVDPRAVRLRLEHEARVAERAVACAVIRDERDADGDGENLVDDHRAEFETLALAVHEVGDGNLRDVEEREQQQADRENRFADRIDRLEREHAVREAVAHAHRLLRQVCRDAARDYRDHRERGVEEHGLESGEEEHEEAREHHDDIDDDAHLERLLFDLLLMHASSRRADRVRIPGFQLIEFAQRRGKCVAKLHDFPSAS